MAKRKRSQSAGEELSTPRQVRFQKDVEAELEAIARNNGMDFSAAVRIALRKAMDEMRRSFRISDNPA